MTDGHTQHGGTHHDGAHGGGPHSGGADGGPTGAGVHGGSIGAGFDGSTGTGWYDGHRDGHPYGRQHGGGDGRGSLGGTGFGSGYSAPIPTGPDGEPPLWAPYYGISFPKAVARFFQKYARFDGRASRSEFWWWILANGIVNLVLQTIFLVTFFVSLANSTPRYADYGDESFNPTISQGPSPAVFIPLAVLVLWSLATIVPSLALGWRRVHDAGLPGPLWIIALFVFVVAVVFGCLEPKPEGAQYDRPDQT